MTVQTLRTFPQPPASSIDARRPLFPNMPGLWITSGGGR
jgi:hypothetical protein